MPTPYHQDNRILIRKVAMRWPHLGVLADRALGRLCLDSCNCQVCKDMGWDACDVCCDPDGGYAHGARSQLARAALRGDQGEWHPQDTFALGRMARGDGA